MNYRDHSHSESMTETSSNLGELYGVWQNNIPISNLNLKNSLQEMFLLLV